MTVTQQAPAVAPGEPRSRWTHANVRYIAMLFLTECTPAEMRHDAARSERPEMVSAIADAMDGLLAEGFDPAEFAESLKSTEED